MAASPVALLATTHAEVLQLLSAEADIHFQGLHQATSRLLPKLGGHLRKRLCRMELAYHFARHVTPVLCRDLKADVVSALAKVPAAGCSMDGASDTTPQDDPLMRSDPWAMPGPSASISPPTTSGTAGGMLRHGPPAEVDPWATAAHAKFGKGLNTKRQDFYIGESDGAKDQEGLINDSIAALATRVADLEALMSDVAARANERMEEQKKEVSKRVAAQLDEFDLRRGQAALSLSGRVAQLASRVDALEPLGVQLEGRRAKDDELEAHRLQVDEQLRGLEAELDGMVEDAQAASQAAASIEQRVGAMGDKFGSVSLGDIVRAIQRAASESCGRFDDVREQLGVLGEQTARLSTRADETDAQLRAAERALNEQRTAHEHKLVMMQRALDELVIADALFPRPVREVDPIVTPPAARTPAALHSESRPTHANEAQPPSDENDRMLGLLTVDELRRLRTASWRHAFLPGLGSLPPSRGTSQRAQGWRRSIDRQRRYREIGYGSGRNPSPASTEF